MQRLAILGAVALGLLGACATQSTDDYDLPADQYPPLDGKADGAALMHLSTAPRGTLSIGDAAWMAWFSNLSYLEPADATRVAQQVAPDAKVSWWVSGTQAAYYIDTPAAGVLVFRGTNEWADWLQNANTSYEPTRFGVMHAGFWDATSSLMTERPTQSGGEGANTIMRDFLAAHHSERLYVTGHSLGGAMATIAYVMLELDEPRVAVHALYTYGAPRAGGFDFAEFAGSSLGGSGPTPVFRFVNRGDIVPDIVEPYRFSHPRDDSHTFGVAGQDAELPYLIHMGDSSIVRGGYEGDYESNADDHAILLYLKGIRDRRSGPAPRE